MEIFNELAFQSWISHALFELKDYFRHLTVTQWGIVSTASVLFGFLCLRSTPVRN